MVCRIPAYWHRCRTWVSVSLNDIWCTPPISTGYMIIFVLYLLPSVDILWYSWEINTRVWWESFVEHLAWWGLKRSFLSCVQTPKSFSGVAFASIWRGCARKGRGMWLQCLLGSLRSDYVLVDGHKQEKLEIVARVWYSLKRSDGH